MSINDLQQLPSVEVTKQINANSRREPAAATSSGNILLHQADIQNDLSTDEPNSNPQHGLGQLIEFSHVTKHSKIPNQNNFVYGPG